MCFGNKNIDLQDYQKLILKALNRYNELACPCAFPRFRQIVGIDCTSTGDSYMSVDTEIFIANAKEFYVRNPIQNQPNDEDWVCKKCSSIFHFNWADFSIAVNRSTLKTIELKANDVGKPAVTPVPLFKGLQGHTYPSKDLIRPASFEEFAAFILEKV